MKRTLFALILLASTGVARAKSLHWDVWYFDSTTQVKLVKYALFILMLLTSVPALATNTITVTITTTAGGNLSVTKTLSDADLATLELAYSKPLIAAGNPSPTAAQEFSAMITSWIAATVQFVQGATQVVTPGTTINPQ